MKDTVREFLKRTLLLEGSVVEDSPDGVEALLPVNAARRLQVPEEVEIHLSSSDPPEADGVLDGRIGSPLLERLVAERLERPAIAAVELPAGLPMPLPDDLPVLLNAVRAGDPKRRHARGRFLAADLRVTLQGEELRSTVVTLTIRLDDGARTQAFAMGGAYPVTASSLADRERANARAALQSWLWREGPAAHAGALGTLRRRAVRDLERLAEYYAGLDAEMARAAERARTDAERRRRHQKWAALPADLESRRQQIRMRVQPRLAARLVAATLVHCDVDYFEFPVRRRKARGVVTLRCRTADGTVEGPACAACGVATLRLYLCDDRLHVLCDACGQQGRLDRARCPACRGTRAHPARIVVEDPTAHLRLGP